MNRDHCHSLLALLFSFIAPFAGHRYLAEAPSGSELMVWAARVGTVMALSLAVFLVLLWSWLAKDAVARGRSRGKPQPILSSVCRLSAWGWCTICIPRAWKAWLRR